MATRVGTILSDENVMKHCAIYRPIPMHLTKSVLHSTQTETQYGKKLKYPSPLSRPTNFDTLATTLTRHSGNDPEIRNRLHTSFRSALTITPANVATPPATPPDFEKNTDPEEIKKIINDGLWEGKGMFTEDRNGNCNSEM